MSSTRKQPCGSEGEQSGSDEFARGAADWTPRDDSSRRDFLRRMAAAIALAGFGGAGCSSRPENETLVARSQSDQNAHNGDLRSFATAMPLSGFGRGVLVTSVDGRPIKIEGNPDHPASLGGTDVFMQASILDLYNPTRLQQPTLGGTPTDWNAFFRALDLRREAFDNNGGAGLRILSGTVTSPTLRQQIEEIEKRYPNARWHTFNPLERRNMLTGNAAAFGRPLDVVYDLRQAKVICTVDSDFLFDEPGSPAYARHFADGRRVRAGQMSMNRLYAVESVLSLTGSMSDHRLSRRPSNVAAVTFALAGLLGVTRKAAIAGPDARFLSALADDLSAHRGESLILAGESQPVEVHAIVAAMNETLGNRGKTVRYIEPSAFGAGDPKRSLAALTTVIDSDTVDTLLIIGGDPAHSAGAESRFAAALTSLSEARLPDGSPRALTAYLGQRSNSTARSCQWQLPETHYLEQWGDVRSHDGTASIIQPLIATLYGGKSAHTLASRVLGRNDESDYDLVRSHWRIKFDGAFEQRWSATLKSGVVDHSPSAEVDVGDAKIIANAASDMAPGWEIAFRADPSAFDGTFAHNAWLQELPRPFTKIVWDNAALLSPASADAIGVQDGDLVRIAVDSRSLDAPVARLPGMPDNTILLHLGYGQQTDEPDESIGFNAYALRTDAARGFASGATVTKLQGRHDLVRTRSHHAICDTAGVDATLLAPRAIATPQTPRNELDGVNRKLVRSATLAELQADNDVIHKLGGEAAKRPLLSLYQPWDYSKGYQWGMSIDQTACIGCNACVVACQAENNIPVVGKEQVSRQREMHWLRIDDYFDLANPAEPVVHHQPVPCMHCENAPCEVVCPVGATTHSVEGLNQMTYNRCVGTRYCSNNCPYKVRRFNFMDYTRAVRESPTKQLQKNPQVTVRVRGVMEKCSYCVQRLQRVKIEVDRVLVDLHERAGRATDFDAKQRLQEEAARREIELIDSLDTACAQACPTRAITFGSILPVAGKTTAVAAAKAQPHDYTLLEELTTKPRTSYLARLRNPNPTLAEAAESRS